MRCLLLSFKSVAFEKRKPMQSSCMDCLQPISIEYEIEKMYDPPWNDFKI